MILSVNGVDFSYSSAKILKDISFELGRSEILSVVGPNGAGKSTLVRCLNRILLPQRGNIVLGGKDINKLNRMAIARRVGYVPQKTASTFPVTVFDTILMGRRAHSGWRSSKSDIEKTLNILDLLDIKYLAMSEFNELSGGQQQKVLLARALSQEPKILLLDEPTSNLDIKQQVETMGIIRMLVKETGLSAVIAIHDLNLAAIYSDSILVLKKGGIHNYGDPFSVITKKAIREVYEVDVSIIENNGKPYVLPICPEEYGAT